MKATISTVKKEGSCNYCNTGELSLGGTMNYPYEKVIIVEGNYIKSNFCEDCFNKLKNI